MNEPLDQLNPRPKPKANPFGKIILGNFAVMLIYMAVGGLIGGGDSEGADFFFIVIQVIINIFLGLGAIFHKGSRLTGLAFLLSGLMVAVIGPGMCSKKDEWLRRENRVEPKHPS